MSHVIVRGHAAHRRRHGPTSSSFAVISAGKKIEQVSGSRRDEIKTDVQGYGADKRHLRELNRSHAQSAAFSVRQNIKTGLAKVRGKPSGLVKRVITKEGRGLWICLW